MKCDTFFNKVIKLEIRNITLSDFFVSQISQNKRVEF